MNDQGQAQPSQNIKEAIPSAPPMDPRIYELLDAIPDTYWRYIARHELFFDLWQQHRWHRPDYRVLDVGCGSGGLLAYFAKRMQMIPIGVDLFPDTLLYCRKRGIDAVGAADATALPFGNDMFDLVIAQDIVEHIKDDAGALAEIYRVCAPSGLALILVPAFESLWSTRDIRLHHYRRYTLEQLTQRAQTAGFRLIRSTYTDLFLLPLLKLMISIAPRTSDGVADISVDSPGGSGLVNTILLAISRIEAAIATSFGLPFGVSAVVLARKTTDREGR